jgi:hypothetical protein
MNTFTIDATNTITAFASQEEARAGKINTAESFGSAQELAQLAASWPARRPVEIWNSFAGAASVAELRPVKKFANRQMAVTRIWKAIQALLPNVGKPAAPVAPAKRQQSQDAPKGTRRHTARRAAKDTASLARDGSKKAEVIELIRRSQGATLAEIMELTGWQTHTVRGFVSGTLTKKLGLKVQSFRSKENDRTYRIK